MLAGHKENKIIINYYKLVNIERARPGRKDLGERRRRSSWHSCTISAVNPVQNARSLLYYLYNNAPIYYIIMILVSTGMRTILSNAYKYGNNAYNN